MIMTLVSSYNQNTICLFLKRPFVMAHAAALHILEELMKAVFRVLKDSLYIE